MDNFQKFTRQFRTQIVGLLVTNDIVIFVSLIIIRHSTKLSQHLAAGMLVTIVLLSVILLAWVGNYYLVQPIRAIWQAVLHIAPDTANTPAPNLSKVAVGREVVTNLVSHIYQIASVADNVEQLAAKAHKDLKTEFVANSLPMPLLVLDKDANIVFSNNALLEYLARTDAVTGQNVYSILDLLFPSKDTLDTWLEEARANKATATKIWERVRLNLTEQKQTRYCDLLAYYNKGNPEGFEIMLLLFDRTRQYSQDEQATSLVALMAHELRTPLTLLRGYIDVVEEETDGKVDAELTDFVHKMKVAAQQLTALITNILNVSRFENDQLTLKLHQEQLAPILQFSVSNMELRAEIHDIKLNLTIDKGLPAVGADAVSINEVVSNLIDNAIKYSGTSKEINIHTYLTSNGLVETTVQDFGVGIPEAAMGSLFEKFYRDYHNRTHVGGTGMGLYLSKVIIDAHGGNIWVQSKEGRGSTFGFTLVPYSQLASDAKKSDNTTDIIRTAHGWIKNHSLYRR
jgi:signal transduction histidine kinase